MPDRLGRRRGHMVRRCPILLHRAYSPSPRRTCRSVKPWSGLCRPERMPAVPCGPRGEKLVSLAAKGLRSRLSPAPPEFLRSGFLVGSTDARCPKLREPVVAGYQPPRGIVSEGQGSHSPGFEGIGPFVRRALAPESSN